MPAPEEVIKLIERFDDNIEAYKSGGYGEALRMVGPLQQKRKSPA
ncbi:hypothetical protein MNBD_NITROSPINAE03-1711 [hydrothermal vent metagenome]|uniref:Uncharacterized protein n=1 Tax=hydrothermal vent metagenome TaxID=652676 RepID=A0A3B1BXS3_9ZZZZ